MDERDYDRERINFGYDYCGDYTCDKCFRTVRRLRKDIPTYEERQRQAYQEKLSRYRYQLQGEFNTKEVPVKKKVVKPAEPVKEVSFADLMACDTKLDGKECAKVEGEIELVTVAIQWDVIGRSTK
jgi:hypothetical protein